MNKKPVEPDEMRIPADKFDELMRHALGAPPPSEQPIVKKARSRKTASPPKVSREESER